MLPILPTAPITNLALIICATIWSAIQIYCVKRELNFAIVDEVDSILIDEARTPLIISAPAADNPDLYVKYAALVDQLEAPSKTVAQRWQGAKESSNR